MPVIKFGATWCSPCKQLDHIIESIGYSDKIEKIDVDADPDKAKGFGIRSIPTLIKTDSEGNELGRRTGSCSKEQFLEFYGNDQ